MTFKEFQLSRQQKSAKSMANYNPADDQDGLPPPNDIDLAISDNKNKKNGN